MEHLTNVSGLRNRRGSKTTRLPQNKGEMMNWFSEVLNQTTEVLNSLCDLVIKEPTYNVLKIKLDKLARKSSKYNILLTLPIATYKPLFGRLF